MQRKHKMTGCARMFFALLIIAPLAYLGASYYNGQDGIQNIKNFLGIGEKKSDSAQDAEETYDNTAKDLEEELADRKEEIEKLKNENAELKKERDALKSEIEKLRGQ